MGLLSLAYGQQNPWLLQQVQGMSTPFAPTAQPEGQGAGPAMFPQPPAPQPQQPAQPQGFMNRLHGMVTGQNQTDPNSWSSKLNTMFESPMMNAGLSLLGNARGSNWGQVAADMRQFGQQQFQRKRLENEDKRNEVRDRREETQFGWMTDAQRQQAAQRQRYEEWAARQTANPDAAVNPTAAFEAEQEARAIANQPITPFQQQSLALQARGQNMDFATSAAAQELRQRSMSLRGPDRDLMETIRNSSGSANELLGLAQMFREANSRTGTGGGSQFIPFSSDRASMRQVGSMMRAMMRPVGSGATSDYEQRLYAMGVPSVDLLGPQNEQIISNIETLARIRNARRYFYEDYADATGSLNGAERAFQQSGEFTQLREQNPLERPRQENAAAPESARSSFDSLPPASQFRDGQRITDSQSGRSFEVRGGRWVPAGSGDPRRIRDVGAGSR